MKKINDYLLVLIFMLTAVLAAAVGLKAYDIYDTNRRLAREQEELEMAQVFARNEEAQSRVAQMESEILELLQDQEELEQFVNKIQSREMTSDADGAVSGNSMIPGESTVSANSTVSGNGMVSGNSSVSSNGTISGNGSVSSDSIISMPGLGSSEAAVSANGTVSGNTDVFGNEIPNIGGTVSGDGEINYYDGSMMGSSIFDEWRGIYEQEEMSLEARRLLRTSLEETLEVNQADRERIAENRTDFSELKIACLGDSITAASNLEDEEDYQQYSYPARLKELLGAREVYNLGIGGSSIGRYWADAFVDRYQEIPEDVDIIIVMGGTNDGFCVSDKEFGSMEERAYRTFCGDLDELMRGLRENYPDAEVFFATPLPNVLQDYLMSERDYLLPQKQFVDVILAMTREYGYHVIDLYNSNILDSHDANVIAEYIPDGVHGNHDGYQIMAEHFAAELVQYYEEEEEKISVSENNVDSTGVYDNDIEDADTDSEEAEGTETENTDTDSEETEDTDTDGGETVDQDTDNGETEDIDTAATDVAD